MIRLLWCGLFFGVVISLSGKPPADLQQRLDAFVSGGPGGVAAAWVDADGTTFFQSGTFDLADPRPITPDTEFEIGSISKVFTALLLAESERAGKVSRLDPAAKYLLPPDDSAQASLAKITLLSLVTHTSGLPRMPSDLKPDSHNPDPAATYDLVQLKAAFRKDGLVAPSGHAMSYSNFGGAVLGQALAAAWGAPFEPVLAEHVLTPLGLKNTTLSLAGAPAPKDLAPGHVAGRVAPNYTFQALAPAGALRSSARDLARFLAFCLGKDETPLRSAFNATLQPQYPADEIGGKIALGWFLSDDSGAGAYWHNGATAGSHSFLAFSPKTGAGIVILANIQKGSETLGFSLLGVTPPHPKVEPVKNAASYVGLYPLSSSFAIKVTETKGVLSGQATGQPAFGMRETAPDHFSVIGVVAEITFERDSANKVVALVLHQNGHEQRAPRGELPPLPKEIVLPAETLKDYIGKYPLSPTFVLTVTEENGGLSVQATSQGKLPIFASAKDEFFYKVIDAQISFERDASGRVTGLVLKQAGRVTPAKKE